GSGWSAERRSALTALTQHAESLGDASLASLGFLGSRDRQHVPLLLAVGQPFEEAPGVRISAERLGEVGGHGDLARRGVQLKFDVHLVAGGDTGSRAVLSAYSDQVPVAATRHSAAVGVTSDRDTDRWLLARSQGRDGLIRNLDARGGLAGELERGAKPR